MSSVPARNHAFTNRRFIAPFWLLLFLAVQIIAHVSFSQAALKVGFGQTVINAPDGTPLAGYYHARGSDGVLDDLRSKAMLLDDGNTKVALVVLDLIHVTRPIVEQARAEIQKRTGIPGNQVMISATHTHTAPELRSTSARSEVFTQGITGGGQAAGSYSERLPNWIAESVQLAMSNAQPSTISATQNRCDDLTFNRRFYLRDGTVAWNPGKLNPQVATPAGTTDPEVSVLLIEALAPNGQFGKARGAYVNFALHPDTVSGTKLSADYPGALSRRLADYHGPEFITVFANGTCGNLNHLDVSWARPQSGPGEANRIGTILAASVFRGYKSLRPLSQSNLRVKNTTVKLPLREITPEEVEQARIDVRTAKDNSRDGFMKLVRGYRNLDIYARQGEPLEVEVQVVSLGSEVAWVSLPGEVFVELGLAIKKHSPFKQTMIAELANGTVGYIPDRRSYAEANYEPESARCAPGSGELLVDAALKLLNELR